VKCFVSSGVFSNQTGELPVTRRFITELTRACRWATSWASSIHFATHTFF